MPATDPFASANDTYSIVVAGSMNPAIHHPAWYKLIGALSDEELTGSGVARGEAQAALEIPAPGRPIFQALSGTMPVSTPPFAQFTAGKLRIMCLPQNWTISTYEESLLSRLREVASSVFEALGHTPVSAYGINCAFHRKTGVGDVGARLAQTIDNTPFGLFKDAQGGRSATIAYTLSQGNRSFNASVGPSPRGADTIFVGINAHHPIVPSGAGFEQFDLTPLFRDSMDKDLRDAKEVLSKVMQTLSGNGKH